MATKNHDRVKREFQYYAPTNRESTVYKIWLIFAMNPFLSRKQLLDRCVLSGYKRSTSSTQYNRWRKYHLERGTAREEIVK